MDLTAAFPGVPAYHSLDDNTWDERLASLKKLYSPCRLCPRRCGALRAEGKPGACRAADRLKVASHNLHFGEEPPISGTGGSGTIFFSGCTLKCLFCQNYPISHLFNGKFYTVEALAAIFLDLQKKGAHNINFVSPTPYLYRAVQALRLAHREGLRVPVVYNTSGYENVETLKALKGVVDIYLPDYKYHHNRLAREFSGVDNYLEHVHPAIEEMFAQCGPLQVDDDGIGRRGTIIRHLLLPGHEENSKEVLGIIAAAPFKDAHLALMSQYFPAYKATSHPHLKRRVAASEYRRVKEYAMELGLLEGWFQDV